MDIFDKNGQLKMPPQSELDALSASERERFRPVEQAYHDMKTAEANMKAATDRVQAGVTAYDIADKALAKFPKPTFHDMHKAQTTFALQQERIKSSRPASPQ